MKQPQRYMYFPVDTTADGDKVYKTVDMSAVVKASNVSNIVVLNTNDEEILCSYTGVFSAYLIYEKVVRLMNQWSKYEISN